MKDTKVSVYTASNKSQFESSKIQNKDNKSLQNCKLMSYRQEFKRGNNSGEA